MLFRLLLVLFLFGLLGDRGAEQGRTGNVLVQQERYAAAETAYRDGLTALDDTTGAVYAALQNNLGVALLRQNKFGDARAAVEHARRAAPTDTAQKRALFNAGIAAAGDGDIEAALGHFRRVLLMDPAHGAARYNYEYLKRQNTRPQETRPSPDVEPSSYARRLKKKAEALVGRRQYEEAASLMRKGLQQDSTVQAYRDFIGRLNDVVQLRESP